MLREAVLFVNKKTAPRRADQKNFLNPGLGRYRATGLKSKNFLVLFYKKELLP